MACMYGNLSYLRQTKKIDIRDSRGCTPFHVACTYKQMEVITYLLTRGVDCNAATTYLGNTPLMIALDMGYEDLALFLIGYGKIDIKHQNNFGVTALHLASRLRDPLIANYLIRKGALIEAQDVQGLTPLFHACIKDNMDVVKCLVQFGARYDVRDMLLKYPVEYARCEKIRELLKISFVIGYEVD